MLNIIFLKTLKLLAHCFLASKVAFEKIDVSCILSFGGVKKIIMSDRVVGLLLPPVF